MQQAILSGQDQYAQYWLSGLPRPPSKEVHALYEVFTFSMQMLPSVNGRTARGTHTVKKAYRDRELTEIARIAAQRDFVGWEVDESDVYLLLYVFTFENARADLDNPTKPTCDLFGQGRSERGHWTDHAWVIWNDNRVWDMRLVRVVEGRREVHWATISIVRLHKTSLRQINPHAILAELGERYDPRERRPSPAVLPIDTATRQKGNRHHANAHHR